MDIKKLQTLVVDALEDVKGQDIAVFDTVHLTSLFDRIAVVSGPNLALEIAQGLPRVDNGNTRSYLYAVIMAGGVLGPLVAGVLLALLAVGGLLSLVGLALLDG